MSTCRICSESEAAPASDRTDADLLRHLQDEHGVVVLTRRPTRARVSAMSAAALASAAVGALCAAYIGALVGVLVFVFNVIV